ncbi:MAG: general secretion pahtway protein D, partial [uncultured bacterium]
LVSGSEKKSKAAKGGAAGGDAKTAAAKANTGSMQLESDVKVTADETTNSLVITASPKDYETLINTVISKLDIPRRQVYLEAVIMDLKVTKQKNLGISGNFGSLFGLGGESMTAFGSVLPGFASELGTIAAATGGLAGGAFSDRTISFTGSDGKAVNIPAVSTIIHALQSDSDANVLSTPSILTLDNEEASIQVGDEVPVKSGTSLGTGGIQNFNVTREDTGVILKVTPQISESDTVRLKISQEVSKLGAFTADGPIFSKRTVDTVVVANDKQTVVIGGLIEDSNTVTTGKVPYLGDVPVLGNLFKNRQTDKTKSNIIVFITPYIIRDKSDYMAILQRKIEERNLFIDLNYGVSQRKQIRESIKNHAKELLEYRGINYHDNSQASVTPYSGNAQGTSHVSDSAAQNSTRTKYKNK